MDRQWRIELLGWLRATRGDQVLTRFPTQKTGALLAYLAFYPQRSHPRDFLIELLWPGCDRDAGRNKLRKALTALRHQQAFREETAVLSALFTDASAPGEAPQSGVLTLFDRPDLLALPPAATGAGPAATSGAHTAALTIRCCLPAPLPMGLTATLGFHTFWSQEAATPLVDGDRVAFHAVAVQ